MASAWATIMGALDALPFALGLGVVLLLVGDPLPPGQRLAVSVLLSVGVGTLLAMISASRYAADGKRFWLSWNFAELLVWWI